MSYIITVYIIKEKSTLLLLIKFGTPIIYNPILASFFKCIIVNRNRILKLQRVLSPLLCPSLLSSPVHCLPGPPTLLLVGEVGMGWGEREQIMIMRTGHVCSWTYSIYF